LFRYFVWEIIARPQPGLLPQEKEELRRVAIIRWRVRPALAWIFQRRWEREKYRFFVGDEVTSLKFHGLLRTSQRLLTSSPTFLTGGYALSAEDAAPLGLDFILVLGATKISHRRRWGEPVFNSRKFVKFV
jgi:hypothetical protein